MLHDIEAYLDFSAEKNDCSYTQSIRNNLRKSLENF